MPTGATAGTTTNLLVLLGVAASFVLMGSTAMLNWRFGYKLGGSDEVERQLFAWGLCAADVVKALMPFSATLAVKKRDWLAAAGAGGIFVIASMSSFYAGIGLASEHRFANEGANSAIIERRSDLGGEKERLQARLEVLGPLPSPAVVAQEIATELAKPVPRVGRSVDAYSDGCTRTLVRTREACATVGSLRVTLERAREAATASERLRQVVGELGQLDSTVQSADPQLDVLQRVARWAQVSAGRDDVRVGLLLFLGLLLELGSGLGLYAVTTPWRHRERGPEGKKMTTTVGDAVVYADERLVPVRGSRMTANAMYADYEGWCAKHNYVPVREGVFTEQMIVVAKDVGIPLEQSGSNLEFCDVGIAG